MTSPIVQNQAEADQAAIAAMNAAIDFIQGTPARIQAAVTAALDNGASAEALAPLAALVEAEKTTAQALTDALAAAQPQQPPQQ